MWKREQNNSKIMMIYYKIYIKYKQYEIECFFFGPNNYKYHADLKKKLFCWTESLSAI
jgi:hypothetical protein